MGIVRPGESLELSALLVIRINDILKVLEPFSESETGHFSIRVPLSSPTRYIIFQSSEENPELIQIAYVTMGKVCECINSWVLTRSGLPKLEGSVTAGKVSDHTLDVQRSIDLIWNAVVRAGNFDSQF